MQNKLLLLLISVLFSVQSRAQFCTDIPIAFSSDSIYFLSSDGFGDSMFVFTMLNEHPTQGFAYPQAKLEPLTPLPSGMSINSINDPWAVYASSWNAGQYSPVHIYYDVDEAIPEDYIVEFKLWINNLSPITDSCFFNDTIKINLNPSVETGIQSAEINTIVVSPNPSQNGNFIINNLPENETIYYTIYDVAGKQLTEGEINDNRISYNFNLGEGMYFINLTFGEIQKTLPLIIRH